MRNRLVLSYLAVVLVILFLLEVPLGVLADRYERSALESQAQSEASSFASLVEDDLNAGQVAQLNRLVDGYRANGKVLVVLPNGTRRFSSPADQRNEFAAVSPMLKAAFGGRGKTSWQTVGQTQSVIAVVPMRPTESSDKVVGAVAMFIPAGATVGRVQAVWLGLTLFALAVLVLTVVVGGTLARGVTSPIDTLAAAVKRLGAGNLSERAKPEGPPELRALATEFNRMAGRIEELVEAQSRFVADASHQLRSPLTALRLRLENLEATEGSASVAAAGREVLRLSRLVDGLLTLSRAEKATPEVRPVGVAGVLRERLEAWEPLATEREVGLSLGEGSKASAVGDLPLVPGDLEQILDNLIGNAVEATSPGGHVVVDAVRTRSGADVSVSDDGPGMTEEDRRRAFDRFWQGAGHRGGSSGLGLAIVNQLALRNHASVELLDNAAARSGENAGSHRGPGLRAVIHLLGDPAARRRRAAPNAQGRASRPAGLPSR